MGTFIADGASVLPVVKTDARPATIPPATTEWAAADANEVRTALLDLRTAAITGMPDPNVAEVTATGSTTARTLATRFSDTVNPLDYGADPTGVATSDAAIVLALAGSQKSLRFTRGTYNLGAQVNVSSAFIDGDRDVILTGAGGLRAGDYTGAVRGLRMEVVSVPAPTEGALAVLNAEQFRVADVWIEGYAGTGSGPGIGASSCRSLLVEDVLATLCDTGLSINDATASAVYTCSFNSSNVQGAYLRANQKLVIDGCRFVDNVGEGLIIDNVVASGEAATNSTTIRDCFFSSNGDHEIMAGTGTGGDNTEINNLTIKDCYFAGSINAPYAILLDWCRDAVIANNEFASGGYSSGAIRLGSRAKNTTITPFVQSQLSYAAGATVSHRTVQTSTLDITLDGAGAGSLSFSYFIPYDSYPPPVSLQIISSAGGTGGTATVGSISTTAITIKVTGGPAGGTVTVRYILGAA